jgi:deoxyribonuclease V
MQREAMTGLIVILDAYTESGGGVGCVLAKDWAAAEASAELAKHLPGAAQRYEPGAFYRRELPLLLAIIAELPSMPSAYVIDGYVWFGPDKPGLGARLYDAIGAGTPVVGVAKTHFYGDTCSIPLSRGKSRRLLHITAAGIEVGHAAALVASMHGEYRIPTLLKVADRLARDAASKSGGQLAL